MLCAILEKCKSVGIPAAGIQLHIKSVSDILDDKLIDFDSVDFDEKIRISNFGKFCNAVFTFLLSVKMCSLDKRLINPNNFGPMEVAYVKVSTFGNIFSKLPYLIQWPIYKILSSLLFSVAAIKKYRWIFSVVTLLTGIITWINTHDITAMLIIFALSIGLAIAILIAWVLEAIELD